jgi:hypothetical protein
MKVLAWATMALAGSMLPPLLLAEDQRPRLNPRHSSDERADKWPIMPVAMRGC